MRGEGWAKGVEELNKNCNQDKTSLEFFNVHADDS